MVTLSDVKTALSITGNYQDNVLQAYFDDVVEYLTSAGIDRSALTVGIVARGVADLWNYGAGTSKLSPYFIQRATQLAYRR
jgi:hypothetical protein